MMDKDFFINYSWSVSLAYTLAETFHKGQVDKAGVDYIYHPMTVASFVEGDEDAMVVALLHDIVEDTSMTNNDIKNIFGDDIAKSLDLVTHREGEPYMDYIKRIKDSGDKVAFSVKLADLKNNMDLSRLKEIKKKDVDRVKNKYIPALEYLLDL